MSEHERWGGGPDPGGDQPPPGHEAPTWPSSGPSSVGPHVPASPWGAPHQPGSHWANPQGPGPHWSDPHRAPGASPSHRENGYGPSAYGPAAYPPSPYGTGSYTDRSYGSGPYGTWGFDDGDASVGAPRRRRLVGARSAAALLVLVAAAAGGAAVSRAVWANSGTNANPGANANQGFGGFGVSPGGLGGGTGTAPARTTVPPASGAPSDISAIASKVRPAVVDIDSSFDYNDAQGAGTGIVLTSGGLVLTNNHVIAESTRIVVTDVGNGHSYGARVVGYDNAHDVALVQLQGASGLATAHIASSQPSVGEAVVAIGNAGGTGGKPTSAGGSVTALGQSIKASDSLTQSSESLSGLIQVNADVQSGDSGGPLVNGSGQVIGMDTAALQTLGLSAHSGSQGYAIPIRQALSIVRRIESGHGNANVHVGATAFLGVILGPVQQGAGSGAGNAPGFGGFGTTVPQPAGLPVEEVVSGGPAQRAGLTGGDYITSFDGHSVSADSDLTRLLVPFHPGQKATVEWVTGTGQQHQATVTLASGPPS